MQIMKKAGSESQSVKYAVQKTGVSQVAQGGDGRMAATTGPPDELATDLGPFPPPLDEPEKRPESKILW